MIKLFIKLAAISLGVGILYGKCEAAQDLLVNSNSQYLQAKNLLVNPGAENGKYGVTFSGGATTSTTTTAANVALGNAAFDWDSNSSAQTFSFTSVTIPAGFYGRNGLAYCNIKGSGATHTLDVTDGTNVIASTTITSAATYQKTYLNFIYPSSGSVVLRLKSVASNEPEIFIDDCFLGEAVNLSQVSQAQFIGSANIPNTASCDWSRTSTSFGSFTTTAACPGPTVEFNPGPGTIQTTDTDLPKFTVNSLPPGAYEVTMIGQVTSGNSGANASLQINDGTTGSGRVTAFTSGVSAPLFPFTLVGYFTYTTTGNRTFELQGLASAGVVNVLADGTNGAALQFSIKRFPSTAELAYRVDQLPFIVEAKHANDCAFTAASASFTDFSADATCTFTVRTNVNGGTVASDTSAGNNKPGIVLTLPVAGSYRVCSMFTVRNSAAVVVDYALTDGTTVFTTSEEEATTTTRHQVNLCGVFTYASAPGAKTFKIQAANSTGTTTMDPGTAANETDWFTVELISPQKNTPLLVGSVTSNSTGIERVERLTFTNAGTPTISTQSGSWVTSLTDNGVGDTTVVVPAGIFSLAPTCTCSVANSGGVEMCNLLSTTTTAVRIQTSNSSTGAAADKGVNLICMGQR